MGKSLVIRKSAKNPKDKGGQPAYRATPEQHALVRQWAAQGVGMVQIGHNLGLCVKTVRKYFTEDVDVGRAQGITEMTGILFHLAREGNLKALIKYLSVMDQARWGEKQTIDLTTSESALNPMETGLAVVDIIKAKQKEARINE